jgi:hypothetical protein
MVLPRRLAARAMVPVIGAAIAAAAGTGVGVANPNNPFYPPTTTVPPIVIVPPPVIVVPPPVIVNPGHPGQVVAPQYPVGVNRPAIGGGMYPVSSPTGGAPTQSTGTDWQPIMAAAALVLALTTGTAVLRRRQLARV